MSRATSIRASLALLLALALGACGEDASKTDRQQAPAEPGSMLAPDGEPTPEPDGGVTPAPDAARPSLKSCVERPNELPRPPSGELPCELLPPGFSR